MNTVVIVLILYGVFVIGLVLFARANARKAAMRDWLDDVEIDLHQRMQRKHPSNQRRF